MFIQVCFLFPGINQPLVCLHDNSMIDPQQTIRPKMCVLPPAPMLCPWMLYKCNWGLAFWLIYTFYTSFCLYLSVGDLFLALVIISKYIFVSQRFYTLSLRTSNIRFVSNAYINRLGEPLCRNVMKVKEK